MGKTLTEMLDAICYGVLSTEEAKTIFKEWLSELTVSGLSSENTINFIITMVDEP